MVLMGLSGKVAESIGGRALLEEVLHLGPSPSSLGFLIAGLCGVAPLCFPHYDGTANKNK